MKELDPKKKISVSYDSEGDVLYLSFNEVQEPAYVIELDTDDDLLLEFGFKSSKPAGFRIINFSKF